MTIDRVLELGYIEDTIFTVRMDSNLNDCSADKWNRIPIARRRLSGYGHVR
jgi:hypothetical protein